MGFLLDLICAVILAASVFLFARRSISSSLLAMGSWLLALCLGAAAALPLASLAGPKWVAPHVERAAANSIADMFSAPHLENGRDTVADLDVQGLVEDDPPAFAKLLHHYGASIEELRAMPPNSTSTDYLAAITREYAAALSKSVLYAVLFTAFFLSARLAARRIELNLVPPAPLRGARRLIPAAIGLAAGWIAVLSLSVLLEWLLPYVGRDAVFFNGETLKNAGFYQILNQFNLFIRL